MKSEGNCGGGAAQPTSHEPRRTERRHWQPEEVAWHNPPRPPAGPGGADPKETRE